MELNEESMKKVMATIADSGVRGRIPFGDALSNAGGWFDEDGVSMAVMFTDSVSHSAVITYLATAYRDVPEGTTPLGLWWAWRLQDHPMSDESGNIVANEEGAIVIFAMFAGVDLIGTFIYPVSPELPHTYMVSTAEEYNASSRDVIRLLKGAMKVAETLQDDDLWTGSTTDGPSDL